jgi:putative copper resistance protein D
VTVSARFGDKVPAEVRVGIVGLGLLPLTVAGHAGSLASQWHDLMMISVELHVLAASAWAGGLAAMLILVMPRRGLLASALPRFSQLAGLCLVVVGASGVITAAAELAITPGIQLPGALLTSHYGQLVLVKTAVVVALAALGSQIRYRLLPLIIRHQRTAVIGWATAEITLMAIAFALGVALSRAPVGP